MITFRQAKPEDLDAVVAIYDLIHDLEEQEELAIGWKRGIYPTRETAEKALAEGDLFVEVNDDKVIASGIINQEQVPEYKDAEWQYDADPKDVLVMHTLTVHPDEMKKVRASAFVDFYEYLAAMNRFPYLRIDTNEVNGNARLLYHQLGYREVSIVPCNFNGIEGVNLVCLEKKLKEESEVIADMEAEAAAKRGAEE